MTIMGIADKNFVYFVAYGNVCVSSKKISIFALSRTTEVKTFAMEGGKTGLRLNYRSSGK